MTRVALKVSPEQEVTFLDLDAPEGALKVMQDAVGGYVEAVRVFRPHKFELYCNDEGLFIEGLERNYVAAYYSGQTILGNVIFVGGVDEDGDGTGLTDDECGEIRGVVSAVQKFLTQPED